MKNNIRITLMSFGFKYVMPKANYNFDVGFIKNPAREKQWDFFSKTSKEMKEYVLNQTAVKEFLDKIESLLIFLSGIDQEQIFAFGCSTEAIDDAGLLNPDFRYDIGAEEEFSYKLYAIGWQVAAGDKVRVN